MTVPMFDGVRSRYKLQWSLISQGSVGRWAVERVTAYALFADRGSHERVEIEIILGGKMNAFGGSGIYMGGGV